MCIFCYHKLYKFPNVHFFSRLPLLDHYWWPCVTWTHTGSSLSDYFFRIGLEIYIAIRCFDEGLNILMMNIFQEEMFSPPLQISLSINKENLQSPPCVTAGLTWIYQSTNSVSFFISIYLVQLFIQYFELYQINMCF